MALVAYLPRSILSMMASVNNDALAEVLVALALLWLIHLPEYRKQAPVWRLGLDRRTAALLTKITITFLVLVVPLGVWLKWRRDGQFEPDTSATGRYICP